MSRAEFMEKVGISAAGSFARRPGDGIAFYRDYPMRPDRSGSRKYCGIRKSGTDPPPSSGAI